MTRRLVMIAALFLVCAGAAPALAQQTARSASVELVRTSKGASKTVAFTLALVEDGAPSKTTAKLADADYHLELQADSATRRKGAQPALMVELSRRAHKGSDALSIRATSTAPIGQRAVLLTLDAGDGATLEVAVTLR